MNKIEKSGMLVNADKEVVGWVNAGEEVEMKEGDVVVAHPKTAEKLGLAEQYKEMKAANKPAKAPKATADGEGKTRTRRVVPKTGAYTVVKTTAATLKEGEVAGERHAILTKLFDNTDFEDFWKDTPEKFEHPGRDGANKTFATTGLVSYAIDRGMIALAE